MRYRSLRVLLWYAVVASGLNVNVTIDDTYGDERTGEKPLYVSTGVWGAFSATNHCGQCVHNPNYLQAYQDTLTTNTFKDNDGRYSNITISFSGHAIWFFVATANQNEPSPTQTRLSFSMDGVYDTTYLYRPTNGESGYNFNILAYASTPLNEGPHTLFISNVGDSSSQSITWFDYAIYETDDGTTTEPSTVAPSSAGSVSGEPQPTFALGKTQHRPTLGAIVGGALGACAVVLLIVLVLVDRRIRRRRSALPVREIPRGRESYIPSSVSVPRAVSEISGESAMSSEHGSVAVRQENLHPPPYQTIVTGVAAYKIR